MIGKTKIPKPTHLIQVLLRVSEGFRQLGLSELSVSKLCAACLPINHFSIRDENAIGRKLMEKGKQRSVGVGQPYEVLLHSDDEADLESSQPFVGIYDRPLPCCGCGIGWFSFLVGFIFPLLWYYGTIRFFWTQRQNDPRERPGLAACAIAALVSTVTVAVTLLILLLLHQL